MFGCLFIHSDPVPHLILDFFSSKMLQENEEHKEYTVNSQYLQLSGD